MLYTVENQANRLAICGDGNLITILLKFSRILNAIKISIFRSLSFVRWKQSNQCLSFLPLPHAVNYDMCPLRRSIWTATGPRICDHTAQSRPDTSLEQIGLQSKVKTAQWPKIIYLNSFLWTLQQLVASEVTQKHLLICILY